ncbi:MAG: hypothetical protein RL701_2891 [Pseudomonadota bacterium]
MSESTATESVSVMSTSSDAAALSDVARRIRDIVCDSLDVRPEDVTPEASFVEDLGADSLDVVDLAIRFEKEFSMSIKDHDYLNLTRLCDATAYVEKRMSAAASATEMPKDA